MSSLIGDPKINALGLVALGLLTEGPRHPYDMYQELMRRREDVIVKIRPGTLYHAIARLERFNFVQAVGTERDGNRPERTTYRITTDGRVVLGDLVGQQLAHPQNEYPNFPVALAQSGRLPKAEVLAHLRYRLSVLERDIAAMRTAYDTLIATGKPARYFIDIDYLISAKDAEIAWLTRTIEAVDGGQLEWNTE